MCASDGQPIESHNASLPVYPDLAGLPTNIELNSVSPQRNLSKGNDDDPFLVSLVSSTDPLNPKNWSTDKKWAVTDVLSATGFNRIMVSTIMAPALSLISNELDMSSTESAMALSIYLLATAIGPLLIGPLSEVYGRKPILHGSNIWFLAWNLVCGFANSKELLIAARFLAGFGASAIYALASGVLGDVWRNQERGRSLGAYLLIPLLGGAVGPIIGGFMAGRTTWRWMFWSTSIFQAAMILVSFSVFDETHAPTILRKQAEKLRRETEDSRYQTVEERLHEHQSPWSVLGKAFTRPVRLLALHPIIQIGSIVSAFDYGILYIVLSTFSSLWTDQYGVSVELSGLHYVAIALGEIAGSQITAFLMDRLHKRQSRFRTPEPESRLPLTLLGATMAPVGLFLYGWAAAHRLHWAIVDLGILVALFGLQSTGMPMQAYIIETYPEHISSAAAASQLLRSLTAFCFPLFAPRMYTVLGYGWANSTLAFAGLVLGVPAPFGLWWVGGRLRGRMRESY
ncbi:major facilitator superfamily domain-containing protein [Aspergillus recurvatus]